MFISTPNFSMYNNHGETNNSIYEAFHLLHTLYVSLFMTCSNNLLFFSFNCFSLSPFLLSLRWKYHVNIWRKKTILKNNYSKFEYCNEIIDWLIAQLLTELGRAVREPSTWCVLALLAGNRRNTIAQSQRCRRQLWSQQSWLRIAFYGPVYKSHFSQVLVSELAVPPERLL